MVTYERGRGIHRITNIGYGTEGHMAVYGPIRHQKNIIWTEACIWTGPSPKKYYMDGIFNISQ
jgi:hypothetical protein